MRITVKTYGPEITSLLGRKVVLNLDSDATVDDLMRILEEDTKTRHGWAQSVLGSGFTVLVNGRRVETLGTSEMNDGDVVTIISPIGGG